MLRSSANLSTYIDITIGMEISPGVCTTTDSTHVTLEPNKMRLSGKENVQCYLSYTVVQCFPNPFPGSGSSANHKTTESVQVLFHTLSSYDVVQNISRKCREAYTGQFLSMTHMSSIKSVFLSFAVDSLP